jgi:hypothetical protein
VRPVGGSVIRYTAGIVPSSPDQLAPFLREELAKLQAVLSTVCDGQLDVTTVAPSKPRDGMLRRADGALWNPGSGQGVYCYYNSAWRFLG